MNRIVLDHYPVAELPTSLRERFASHGHVRLVVESIAPQTSREALLEELFAEARPSFKSLEDVADHIRSIREEWD